MHYFLPFPVTNALTLTGPLFVFLIDYLLNNITCNRKQAVGITAGLVGVVIASNSDYFLTFIDLDYSPKSTFTHYKSHDPTVKMLLALLAVLSNVGWAYAIVIQKRISHVPGIKISYFLGV